MKFLINLYGSQYYELNQKGRDGNRGRMNANLYLSALIILFLFALLMICISFVPGFNETITRAIRKTFGHSSGKSIGKLVALPLMAIIYLLISLTTGNKKNFKSKVEKFMQYPDEVKKKANAKLLIPFFVLGVIVFVLAMAKLF